jgi:predicted ATPase
LFRTPRLVLLMAGDVGPSEAMLQVALDFVDQSGERFWLADLYRLDGEIALRQPELEPERAEASFLRAVDIAHVQESRLVELRAANSLAVSGETPVRPMTPA